MALIHWLTATNGSFSTGTAWKGGVVPGALDVAAIDAAGAAFTVTVSAAQTVRSFLTSANATLSIVDSAFYATLGTAAATNAGTISVEDSSTLAVGGTIANSGLISLNAGADTARLVITANATLTGLGHLTLSDNAQNLVYGASALDRLNNASTIAGAGQLGAGQLTFDNLAGGVVDATGTNNSLVLNTGTQLLVNAGLIEATGSAGLVIDGGAISGAGTISAANGSSVFLMGATLEGGTLTTAGTGAIYVSGSGATLNDSAAAVVNDGALHVEDGAALSIQGSITNAGVIALDPHPATSPAWW